MQDLENSSLNLVKIITGDFNHCNLGKSLLWYQQLAMFTAYRDCKFVMALPDCDVKDT